MFVECFKNNGIPYLRLVESNRVRNKNGDITIRKKLILSIGPLSRYDDGKPDYVGRLKESFKAGEPLIPSLKPYCQPQKSREIYRFSFKEGSPDCFGHSRLFSHVLLERILEELGLNTFFSSPKKLQKQEYDLYGSIAKQLIFDKFYNPTSRCDATPHNQDYYEPFLEEDTPDKVDDTLDFLSENKDKVIRTINTCLSKKGRRSLQSIYLGIINYGTSESTKGRRGAPFVQIGLFMDNNGLPISFTSSPGKMPDPLTLGSDLGKNFEEAKFSRFILIADSKDCRYGDLLRLKDAGNGYLLSKSLRNHTENEQEWTYDDADIICVNDEFKYKSRIVKTTVKEDQENNRVIEEKVIVYWGGSYQKRAEKKNKKFLDFLKQLQERQESFPITADQAESARIFLKEEFEDSKTDDIVDSSKLRAMIDFEKVKAYRKSLGARQLVTSELDMDPREVIQKFYQMEQVKEQFRVLANKNPFSVKTQEQLTAHMLICLIALLFLRIIQEQILSFRKVTLDPDIYQNPWLSADRIRQALLKWKVDTLSDDLYRFEDMSDPDLKLILNAFHIQIPAKLYRKAELDHLKTEIKVFPE